MFLSLCLNLIDRKTHKQNQNNAISLIKTQNNILAKTRKKIEEVQDSTSTLIKDLDAKIEKVQGSTSTKDLDALNSKFDNLINYLTTDFNLTNDFYNQVDNQWLPILHLMI